MCVHLFLLGIYLAVKLLDQMSMFTFSVLLNTFLSGSTILNPQQRCMRATVALNPHQLLVLSAFHFSHSGAYESVSHFHTEVLTYISLKNSKTEHIIVCSLAIGISLCMGKTVRFVKRTVFFPIKL